MTAPTDWVASAATTNSYQFGSWIDTTSPAPTPRAPSQAAKRALSAASSA